MKIEIEIPDWCNNRHIYIMAGIEMVAYKLYGEDVIHVKKTPCAKCGNCCRGLNPAIRDVNPDGICKYLGMDGVKDECGLNCDRPFACSTGMQQKCRTEGCSIEYEIVKL